ncbi:MAG: putative transposase, partial [Cocleimonas sp.]
NAPTERFFRSFKHEHMHYYRLKTKKDAELCILDYLAYYNSKRPHTPCVRLLVASNFH